MNDPFAHSRAAYDADPAREWQRLEGGAQMRLEYLITTDVLRRHLPAPDQQCRVLDAGGGPGRYTFDLAARGYTMTLLDLSPALLQIAEQRLVAADPTVRAHVAEIVEGTVIDLSAFCDAQFDAVLCLGGVLSHLTEPRLRQRALDELQRVTRPDGVLFISVMNRLAGYRSVVQWPHAWAQIFERDLATGTRTMGPAALPVYAFLLDEFEQTLIASGLRIERFYGCQGLGAHLQEEHLLALMADEQRWPQWRAILLATCDDPSIIGVSSHLLGVTRRTE